VSLNGGRAVAASMARSNIIHEVFDGPLALFDAIRQGRVDRVFNLLHGPDGEDGSLQGALQLMRIPVTGADLASSALSMDKVRSKWVWERNGIPTPPFMHFGPRGTITSALESFGLPVFVKPTCLGSSIGYPSQVSKRVARQWNWPGLGSTIGIEKEIRW
jgi:D-alanine-D-alanine ligase